MKVLVTGANGNVGKELLKQSESAGEFEIILTDKDTLDITNPKVVLASLSKNKPEMVIHLAAATDVDWCESHPEECYEINTQATQNLAQAAKDIGAVFVFPSTTFVFGGEGGKVYDDRVDEPSLEKVKGVYAKSKLLAEKAIEKVFGGSGYFIVRFGQLFFGGEESLGGSKKFVEKILEKAQKGEEIQAVEDRRVQPTYLPDAAKNLLELIKTKHWGIYNLVGHGQASYYEFAKAIVETAGLNAKVTPISSSEFKEIAPRPKDLQCINGKLQDLGLDLMRDWRIIIGEYLSS